MDPAQSLPVITVFLWRLTSSSSMGANTDVIRIPAGQCVAGNIPRVHDNRLEWQTREAEPPPGYFFAKWEFDVAREGQYGIYACSEPSGTLHMSRHLLAVDQGEFVPARTIRKLDLKASFEQKRAVYEPVFEVGRVDLKPGRHTLTVRAGREQRFWFQGRDGGHRQFLEAIEFGGQRAVDSHYRLAYDVLCLKPNWFILAMGVNDAFFFDRSQFARHWEYILDRVKNECDPRIVLPTPTNLDEHPSQTGAVRMWEADRVLAYNRAIEIEYLPAIESLAQRYGAVRVDIYRPDALAVSADGSRLYVALEPASKILPITLPSLAAQAPFDSAGKPEFALPRRVVARRDGSLLVANYYERVTLLGAAANVIATLEGGSLLNDVAIAPDDKTVAAAYSMNKELWRYDLADGKKRASAPGHSYLTQVRFAGNQVLSCDYDDGSLFLFEPTSGQSRWLPLGQHPRDIAVASSGREAYVSLSGDNQVCAVQLDPANPTVARRFSVGAGPGALLLDEAARCLNVSCVKDGAIWRIDLETGQAARWASLEGCLAMALVTLKE